MRLKDLKFTKEEILLREQLKTISGGARNCFVTIQYDDGYTYTANQGSDVEGCRALVNTTFTDSFGTATVKNCFCTSYSGGTGPGGGQIA